MTQISTQSASLESMIFYKITNRKENHYGYQYKPGLNILPDKFNDDPLERCCSGGFYITTIEHLGKFLNYGENIRQIKLPFDNPEFKIVKDPSGDKWRCNMLELMEPKYSLFDVKTYQMLLEQNNITHIAQHISAWMSTQFISSCSNTITQKLVTIGLFFLDNKLSNNSWLTYHILRKIFIDHPNTIAGSVKSGTLNLNRFVIELLNDSNVPMSYKILSEYKNFIDVPKVLSDNSKIVQMFCTNFDKVSSNRLKSRNVIDPTDDVTDPTDDVTDSINDITHKNDPNLQNALILAIKINHHNKIMTENNILEYIKLLVSFGADINYMYPNHETIITLASYYGYCDIVEYLIFDNKAKVPFDNVNVIKYVTKEQYENRKYKNRKY